MILKNDIKKIDVELKVFMKNIEHTLYSIIEKMEEIYKEHNELMERVGEIERKLNN